MNLFVLLLITLFFLGMNFFITKGDFLAPSTLFCEMFFLYELICVIGQSYYAISIHGQTVIVITCGLFVFTVWGLISQDKKFSCFKSSGIEELKPKYIAIPKILVYMLIVLQLGTIFYFVQYLQAISVAYGNIGASLGEMISLYDTMTKFWTEIFRELNVTIPMFYRVFNPVTSAAAYIVLYVAVNNFMVRKKVEISHLIVIALLCVLILLNGSRSPLLRIVTMVIILMYVLYYRTYQKKKKGIKTFIKLVGLMLIVAGAMFLTLFVMGRITKLGNIGGYLFTYLGAPIVNLDTFLAESKITFLNGMSELFGEHTFHALYAYLGKIFHIARFTSIEEINTFAMSSNGIEIGNVYTTFYMFAYDFGYIGVLPLISVVAAYYTLTYRKVLKKRSGLIDFNLFIYSYLFNDLVMLTFSNRFFETVLDAPFIKHFLISWFLIKVLFNRTLAFGSDRIRFKLLNY